MSISHPTFLHKFHKFHTMSFNLKNSILHIQYYNNTLINWFHQFLWLSIVKAFILLWLVYFDSYFSKWKCSVSFRCKIGSWKWEVYIEWLVLLVGNYAASCIICHNHLFTDVNGSNDWFNINLVKRVIYINNNVKCRRYYLFRISPFCQIVIFV